jgi:antirestriction protein ArdC
MPHAAPAHKSFSDRASLYQGITDKIIRELEQGRVPWVQPWLGSAAGVSAPLRLPSNAATGRPYSGINILILWCAVAERGFTGQNWLTFRQALKIGAHVRKGEKGTTGVYADRFIPYRERTRASEAGDEPEAIPFKRFTVFNADQCEDLPADISPPPAPVAENLILPQAEALIRATGADLRIGGTRAFYVPSADYIQVPPPSAFFEPINFHRTVCHELGHWSGGAHRLNRNFSGGFGSSSYAREELIAEVTGAFVCAALSIVPTVRHADYLGSWLEVPREDNRAIFAPRAPPPKRPTICSPLATRTPKRSSRVLPFPQSSGRRLIFPWRQRCSHDHRAHNRIYPLRPLCLRLRGLHLRQRLGANRHATRRVILRNLDQSRAARNLHLLRRRHNARALLDRRRLQAGAARRDRLEQRSWLLARHRSWFQRSDEKSLSAARVWPRVALTCTQTNILRPSSPMSIGTCFGSMAISRTAPSMSSSFQWAEHMTNPLAH